MKPRGGGAGQQGELFAAPARRVYERVAEVAVAAPIRHLLSYAIPDGMPAASGFRVQVPIGARATSGFLVSIRPGKLDEAELKAVIAIDPRPMLTPVTLALGQWMADHYGSAPGEAFQTIVPAPVRAGGGARTAARGGPHPSGRPGTGRPARRR